MCYNGYMENDSDKVEHFLKRKDERYYGKSKM